MSIFPPGDKELKTISSLLCTNPEAGVHREPHYGGRRFFVGARGVLPSKCRFLRISLFNSTHLHLVEYNKVYTFFLKNKL